MAESKPKKTAIFSKIKHFKEHDELFENLASANARLLLKVGRRILVLKATKKIGDSIKCVYLGKQTKVPRSTNSVVCNFSLGGERYFFLSNAKFHNDSILLSSNTELYHLQRRNNYRVVIPESLPAIFELDFLNRTSVSQKFKILDLSAGGAKLRSNYKAPIFREDDILTGTLNIKGRRPLAVKCKVKHHAVKDIDGKHQQFFGVEFIPKLVPEDSYLFTIVMDLHREINSPWATVR